MRKLNIPPFNVAQVITACIASLQAGDLKAKLPNAVQAINSAEANYLVRGPAATLNEIAGAANVGGIVSREEMERIYKGTFVKSRKTRHFYDAIKKLPPNDICPICNQRTVFTLEHYLPKAFHPS